MAPATQTAVCGSREAVTLGSAWASALRPDGDPEGAASDLRRAASAAPEAIRADFNSLVDAQLPFLELLARVKASGNYATITTDPEFQRSIEALSSPRVATATARINQWFAAHCAKPR